TLLIGIVLCPALCLGQDNEAAKTALENATNKAENINKSACANCQTFAVTEKAKSIKTKCLEKICPDGYGFNGREINQALARSLEKNAQEEFGKALGESLGADLIEQLKAYQALLNFVEKGPGLLTEPVAIRYFQIFEILNNMGFISVNTAGRLDEKATQENLKGTDPATIPVKIAIAKKLVEQTNGEEVPEIVKSDIQHLAQSHAAHEIHSEIKSVHGQIVAATEQLSKTTGLAPGIITETSLLEGDEAKRLLDGTYTRSDLAALSSAYVNSVGILKITTDAGILKSLQTGSINLKARLGAKGIKRLKGRIEQIQKYFNTPHGQRNRKNNPLRERIYELSDTCATALQFSQAFLPSEKDKENFRLHEPAQRQLYLKGLSSFVSGASAKKIEAEIKTWKLGLPLSPDEFKKTLMETVSREKLISQENIALFDKAYTSNGLQAALAVQWDHDKKRQKKLVFGERLSNICEEMMPRPLPDRMIPGTKNLTLGPLSTSKSPFATGVAFHEYSHLVNQMVLNGGVSPKTADWFKKSQQCLASQNKGEKYVEEDWADMVSAVVSKKNLACYFVDEKKVSFSLANSNEEDSHSSDLRRALYSYFILNSDTIPGDCTEALAKQGEIGKFKNCVSP
ncbi:MAG: hypothetical protein AB7K41_13040, partial [Bdellovibrionales bacterium]